ncbi:hypothetical protein NOK64_24040 [Vibrio parahaemolyticus]|uniref:hypothetical protein n=1 Tax=Vibrio parahaemolyticus TaxID=670 RepID=UPI00226A9751|nr:hypothetical protein [Vibrio parahaemolyticus]MCX8758905.1 hypothetical protein [Vibrio parahaemolyticus]
MSDPVFQALIESNRRLTETVEGKVGEIDNELAKIPLTIQNSYTANYYVDKYSTNTVRDGKSKATACRSISELLGKITKIPGSTIFIRLNAPNNDNMIDVYDWSGLGMENGVFWNIYPYQDQYTSKRVRIRITGENVAFAGSTHYYGFCVIDAVSRPLNASYKGIFRTWNGLIHGLMFYDCEILYEDGYVMTATHGFSILDLRHSSVKSSKAEPAGMIQSLTGVKTLVEHGSTSFDNVQVIESGAIV